MIWIPRNVSSKILSYRYNVFALAFRGAVGSF
jgi:hypothetical protein